MTSLPVRESDIQTSSKVLHTSDLSVRIIQTRALSYRVPKEGSRLRPTNYLVEIRGEDHLGRQSMGVGESQPRGLRTGDDITDSWPFLEAVISDLEGKTLDRESAEAAVDSVKQLMNGYIGMAKDYAKEDNQRRPFRGTLLGVEIALLDLAANVLGITVASLLGQRRKIVPLAPMALSRRLKPLALKKAIREQGDQYGAVRVAPKKTMDESLAYFERVYKLARRRDVGQVNKPLWIDFSGSMDRKTANTLVKRIAKSVGEGLLPTRIILEQPISSIYGDHLPVLQKLATEELANFKKPNADIRIMGDETVWDKHSIGRLRKFGPVSAIDIRPAQAGGLIASMELAQAALEVDPDAVILLTRMPGASRITSSALRHLALALPRVDAATIASSVEKYIALTDKALPANAGPTDNVAAQGPHASNGATPKASGQTDRRSYFSKRKVSKKRFQVKDTVGLGMRLVYSELVKPTINMATFPEPTPPMFEGKAARTYDDVDYIKPLGPYGVHGHLIEREALARGLNTKRFSKATFLVDDGHKRPISFRTARWPLSSAVASSIVRHKESTRLLLNRHGVPVPQGRTFAPGDAEGALAYASRIGYPVVLKPAAGSMGVGVTANISNDSELNSALSRLENSIMGSGEFIVEQHVPGNDYRIMVIGDEVIAAVERMPASVLGDGRSTVAELILEKNAIRKLNPHLGPLKLKWNASVGYEIGKQGLTADSVLEDGQRLYLNSINNLTQGGDSIEVLDELHPSIVQASIDAVAAVPGLTYCGVDFLLEDHTKPLNEQNGAVCELNAVAAIPVAEYPVFGTPRPLSEKFLSQTVEQFGLEAWEKRSDTLNLHIKVRGKVIGVGYRKWFSRRADRFGCSGWIRNASPREVEIRVSGPAAAVSALAMATVLGPPLANPTSVRTVHSEEPLSGSFEIV